MLDKENDENNTDMMIFWSRKLQNTYSIVGKGMILGNQRMDCQMPTFAIVCQKKKTFAIKVLHAMQ
jgi:hypothetical protein